MLAGVVQAVANALAPMAVDAIYTWPNPGAGDSKVIIVYGVPGDSEPEVQTGENGKMIFNCRDLIVVEWSIRNNESDFAKGSQAAAPEADRMRMVIWQAYAAPYPDGNFYGAIQELHSANLSDFGQTKRGSTPVFGFRMLLDVTHGVELD